MLDKSHEANDGSDDPHAGQNNLEDENSSDFATSGVSKGVKGSPATRKRSRGVQEPDKCHDPCVSKHQIPQEDESMRKVDAIDELGQDCSNGNNDGKHIGRRCCARRGGLFVNVPGHNA